MPTDPTQQPEEQQEEGGHPKAAPAIRVELRQETTAQILQARAGRVEAAAQLQEVQLAAVAWMVGPRSPPLPLVCRPKVRPLQLRRRV